MFNPNEYEKLPYSFFTRSNVVQIAKDLVGKYVFTHVNEVLTVGKIVETEAYNGRNDKACHAYHKRTPRTEVMYGEGGTAYVCLCYGIHHLFNIVTNEKGLADAVLIRAVEPVEGIAHMIARRGGDKKYKLTSGPGVSSQALGVTTSLDGVDLTGEKIWIGQKDESQPKILTDRRVGVDYAEEDALLPWRFFEENNPWISKGVQPPMSKFAT